MYLRFRPERPVMSGNARRRKSPSRSITRKARNSGHVVRRGSGWLLFEVEGQQVLDIGIVGTLRQFGENVSQPCEGFDAAGTTGQHQAVDDGAGVGALDCIAEEPALSSGCKNPDVAL